MSNDTIYHDPRPRPRAPLIGDFKAVEITAMTQEGPKMITTGLVTDESFDIVISNPKPVCVYFTTPGCGACANFKNVIMPEALAVYQDRILFYEFICSTVTKRDKEEDVVGHPNVFFYLAGKNVGHVRGAAAHFEYLRGDIRAIKEYAPLKLEGFR